MLPQNFDEVIVVGEHHSGAGYRYLHVPKILGTTTDALIKRDVATLAAESDALFYLCDDHALFLDALAALRAVDEPWDILCPARWGDHPEQGRIPLNMGIQDGYIGGHAGIYQRHVVARQPWTTMPHHPNWDVLATQEQHRAGAWILSAPAVRILDITPETKPWQQTQIMAT